MCLWLHGKLKKKKRKERKKQRLEEGNGKVTTAITFTSSTRSWVFLTKGELYENRHTPQAP